MPVTDVQSDYITDTIKGLDTSYTATQANLTTIEVTGTEDASVYAVPFVWDSSTASWVAFTNSTAATIPASLTAGVAGEGTSPLGFSNVAVLSVGTSQGFGFDGVFGAGAEDVTVLYRGASDAAVVSEGIKYPAGTTDGNKAIFETQLVSQGIIVQADAEVVSPTYTS